MEAANAKLMTFDLIVIGGGPAGCAASITAARAGARVLQLERGRFPRHKVCGEFVSAESLELLRQLVSHDHAQLVAHAPKIPRTRIFLDNAELVGKVSPAAASVTRFDLDHALWNSAIQSGVDAREDRAVQSVSGTGPFLVNTAENSFEAEAIINATGRWSNLTSPQVRARTSGERWIGIKAHFREPRSFQSVDLYFFDGGYCGVQPVSVSRNGAGTMVNACAMVRAEVASTLQDVFSAHPALLERSRHWIAAMDPITTSPLVFHEPELVYNSMLQVGDSATFVDPFIGDGISLALQSGALAAQCLNPFFKGECSLEQATSDYCAAYQRKLSRVFRNSSRLRRLLQWPSIVRKPALSILQRTPAITSMLVRMTR
jgi:flavin-dependent dehydrogenase